MPYTYSNVEYADMVFIYGLCNGSASAAVQEYSRKYPDRRCPSAKVFYSVFQHLRDHGSFPGIKLSSEKATLPNRDEDIIDAVVQSPGTSTRRISCRLQVSRMKVWRTLRKEGLHPYHPQKVQHLQPEDLPKRIDFCRWLQDHSRLWKYILYTDEAIFTRAGIHNPHNEHHWSKGNPKEKIEKNFQHRFSVNVWCGVVGNLLIGPHIFQDRLNGETYATFLRSELPSLLDDVPLRTRKHLIFQHDGAPPHYSRQARDHLNTSFPNLWIGRGGTCSWPARSPDLSPLDFYLWGHMKSLVYRTKSNSKQELLEGIMQAAEHIQNKPDLLRKATHSVLQRTKLCIEAHGGHFEHLMK